MKPQAEKYRSPEFVLNIRATDAAFMASAARAREIISTATLDVTDMMRERGVRRVGLGTGREIVAAIGCLLSGQDVQAECRAALGLAARRAREE